MTDWKSRYYRITNETAEIAAQISRDTMGQSVYCCVKEANGNGEWGEFEIITQNQEVPPGFTLLSGERFPQHMPYSTWGDFIRNQNPRIIGD